MLDPFYGPFNLDNWAEYSLCVYGNKSKSPDSCSGLGVGERYFKPIPGEVPKHPLGGAIWTLKVPEMS